jgi:O-antigen/teichoic acid export membrane protein
VLAGHRPRLYWSVRWCKQMLGFGSTAAAGTVLDRARDAAIPLIVGHFGGASGIGVVTLAMRLVDTMGFARRATWRLAVVAVGWLHTEPARLRRALQESTALQVLAVGPILAVFAVLSPWLVPRLFGSRWDQLIEIFPYFALAQLAASLFTMHGSTLLAIGNARAVATSNLARIALVVVCAFALGPRYGIPGASAAVAISILGFVPLHAALRKFVRVSYRAAVPLLVMFVPLICAPFASPQYTPLFAIPLAVSFAVPAARRDFTNTLRVVFAAFAKQAAHRRVRREETGRRTDAATTQSTQSPQNGPGLALSSAEGSATRDAPASAEPSARGEVPLLLLDAPQQPSGGRLDAEPSRTAGSPRHRRHR